MLGVVLVVELASLAALIATTRDEPDDLRGDERDQAHHREAPDVAMAAPSWAAAVRMPGRMRP